MHSLAHYALLGSLIAGAAGALVLAAITLKHGIQRRLAANDHGPEEAARRQRLVRLADTLAVLCFAVSAGLGVVGLMQQMRAVPPAVAAVTDDSVLGDRLQALEKRVATAELELQARGGGSAAPEWRAWEERIARLENRLGAIEDRVSVAARREERPRRAPTTSPRQVAPASTPRAVTPSKPAAPPPAPSAAPRPSPGEGAVLIAPEVAASPKVEPTAPDEVAPSPKVEAIAPVAVAKPARESPRARVEPPAPDPSLGEKLRRDWDAIKRQARRGGDEWRDGWDQLKRLFGY